MGWIRIDIELRYVIDAQLGRQSTGLNCSLALDVATTCDFCRSPHRYVRMLVRSRAV
jgi:hypothetical protein